MKKHVLISFAVLLSALFISAASAQEKGLTASQILQNADSVVNAPKDQDMKVKIVLTDKNGAEKTRELTMLQKGSDRRVAKFLSPADQRGIGFLSLPHDEMYLYLPAFHKVRRIASYVKNTKFAGTDFTYEDMEAKPFSEKYMPSLLRQENNQYVLQLEPKPGIQTDYSKLIMWVRMDNFYPTRIEYYDKGGKLYKVMTREKIEKVGKYWTAKETTMEDLKEKHKTTMILLDVKFDTELSNEEFSPRYLER